ncbi:MAG TPA: carboxypeptidase-like regulatory domain-containing protein [Planctomycetota bacterium]
MTIVVASSDRVDHVEGLVAPVAEQATPVAAPATGHLEAAPGAAASDQARVPPADPAAAPAVLPCGVDGFLRTGGGRAVPNSLVFLVSRDLEWRQHTTTGPDGRFEFTAAVGEHTLVVPAFARLPGVEQVVELRPSMTRVDVTLPLLATARIDGCIVDTDGVPLGGTRAELRTASAPAMTDVVETNHGGYFHLADVPVGDLVLRTSEPIQAEVRGHMLTAGATTSVQFVLDLGRHSIAGRVVTRGGQPAVGAHVRFDRSLNTGTGVCCLSTRTLVTDRNGCFEFERLGPGPGTLTVLANGCVTEIVGVEEDSSPVVVVRRITN